MKGKKKSGVSSFVRSVLVSWFCVFDRDEDVKNTKVVPPSTGPEATMVAATKHFSSAHKVRLI